MSDFDGDGVEDSYDGKMVLIATVTYAIAIAAGVAISLYGMPYVAAIKAAVLGGFL